MEQEPKGGLLPLVILVGAGMLCCLGPVLFVSGASGLAAWLGGIDPLLAVGIAVAICALIVLFRRARKSIFTEAERESPPALRGDQ